MSPQAMITVKYIGKFDAMTLDFNHKRYVFRAKSRVSTIPSEVYDHIKKQKDMLSYDLVPHQEGEIAVQKPMTPDGDFLVLGLKEYQKLSKEDKKAYSIKKAAWEAANVK